MMKFKLLFKKGGGSHQNSNNSTSNTQSTSKSCDVTAGLPASSSSVSPPGGASNASDHLDKNIPKQNNKTQPPSSVNNHPLNPSKLSSSTKNNEILRKTSKDHKSKCVPPTDKQRVKDRCVESAGETVEPVQTSFVHLKSNCENNLQSKKIVNNVLIGNRSNLNNNNSTSCDEINVINNNHCDFKSERENQFVLEESSVDQFCVNQSEKSVSNEQPDSNSGKKIECSINSTGEKKTGLTTQNCIRSSTNRSRPVPSKGEPLGDDVVGDDKSISHGPVTNAVGVRPTPSLPQDVKVMEYQELKRKLDNVSMEKQALESKINNLLNYQDTLRDELFKIKEVQDSDQRHILSRSPLSDTTPGGDSDHHPIHLGGDSASSSTRHAVSAPASIAPTLGVSSEHLDTPDWDKHSSSSLSEISLACLQDRITQMEETHYCTNEELQATLQELADLQNQLLDLQHANETLGHEKGVLLESLCRQTEKLEDTRTRAETLQELLLNGNNAHANPTERETKLVELLQNAQAEKETLLEKQEQMSVELVELRRLSSAMKADCDRANDRLQQLERTIETTRAEKNQMEHDLAQLKEEANARLIEIQRVTTLLENARAKIGELEEDRDKLRDKSELDELLNAARKEKDTLESQVAGLENQVALLQDVVNRTECKASKQEETIAHLQEEIKVARNNAKSSLSDLEYERNLNVKEIERLKHELELLHETYNEVQVQLQCHLDDKRQLKTLLSETQKHLSETQSALNCTNQKLQEERAMRDEEVEEWNIFQKDLLMAVRVANDFKTDAQLKQESLVLENKELRDKNRNLVLQLDKLKKVEMEKPIGPVIRTSECSAAVTTVTPQSVYSSVINREINRHNYNRQDSKLSVKSLIESIENATKQAKTGPSSSLNSSTSSLNSMSGVGSPISPMSPILASDDAATFRTQQNQNNNNNNILSNKKCTVSSMLSSTPDIVHETLKPPSMKPSSEETSSSTAAIFESLVRRNSQSDLSERKDPLQALVKNGGSKRNALLKWCQNKTVGYHNIDITNFSSSWNDGLALCAILHAYLPDKVPYDTLTPNEKRRNFTIAFAAAESVGIFTTLNIHDMITQERPDWNQVMAYVTSIYKHFET